jgi:hypothetical protein
VSIRHLGHGAEAKELWFKTSIMAGAFIIIPYTAFVLMKEMQHEHHDKVDFPHMHREFCTHAGRMRPARRIS